MKADFQTLAASIETGKGELARQIVVEQWSRNPKFETDYGDVGFSKCVQDVTYNLSYLSQAIAVESPPLFNNYVEWIQVLFKGLNIPVHELRESLTITIEVLGEHFPDHTAFINRYIQMGLEQLDAPSAMPESYFYDSQPHVKLARQYLGALRAGDRSTATDLILGAVNDGASVREMYLHVFQPSQLEVGRLWQINEMNVAQEHFCTASTQLIMSLLYPQIFKTPKIGRRLVATCVGNELHEIGLRMVADFFEMEGWDTYYLGANVPAGNIMQSITDRNANVLAISATMTYHVSHVVEMIEQVREKHASNDLKILVGGYPFNIDRDLWRHVGADGSAANAEAAIKTASALVGTV